MWFQLVILSVALSIDGFGVGVSLGMRGMKIPFKSIVVISICSAISLGVAMLIGEFISLARFSRCGRKNRRRHFDFAWNMACISIFQKRKRYNGSSIKRKNHF